jgi:DNA polymerase-3 subunit gamma/tau
VFDNLLGQDEVASQLRRDLGAGELPSSLLFAGPPASGKLTTALELARLLSCQSLGPAAGAWACACPACNRHRILAHSDLLLFGPRTFPEEIPAARSLLERSPVRASAFFFVRAVRKLQKRFDAALYEGEESRMAKAAPLVREIEERIDAVRPELLGPDAAESKVKEVLDAARAATDAARRLEALVADTTPVFQVRAAEYWARLAPNGRMKTVVIENADRMLDASRNALLKILEETPASVEFVLLSSRRSALLATILSRVRPYVFAARPPEDQADVLERIFKAPPEIVQRARTEGGDRRRRENAIGDFLASERPFPPEEARRLALEFLGAAAARRLPRPGLDPAMAAMPTLAEDLAYATSPEAAMELGDMALADLGQATKDFGQKDDAYSSSFLSFLEALSGLLGDVLRLPGLGPSGLFLVDQWAALIRDAKTQCETLNRSPGLLAESLLYGMGSP